MSLWTVSSILGNVELVLSTAHMETRLSLNPGFIFSLVLNTLADRAVSRTRKGAMHAKRLASQLAWDKPHLSSSDHYLIAITVTIYQYSG